MLAPVGPLPPSIYWRRRLAALVVIVVVSALLIWALAALGGDSAEPEAAPAPSAPGVPTPAALAAPSPAAAGARPAGGGSPTLLRGGLPATALGPTALGSAAPGSGAGGTGAAVPGAAVPGAGATSVPGVAGVPGPTGRVPGAGVSGAGVPGGPDDAVRAARAADPLTGRSAAPPPAPVPTCPDSAVTVRARTDKPRYAPGEKPVLGLVVTNTGTTPCRRDLDAARQAVAVVHRPGDGLWSSNDCADVHTDDVRVLPPGGSAEFTVRWSGRTSSPGCGGEREPVPAGAYQLLARLDRTVSDPVPFILG